jgi:hypothetical protein
MSSITRFIERHLKLRVNTAKSAVAHPWDRTFLGFTVRNDPEHRRCIAGKAIDRFKNRVRELTRRHRGVSVERMIADLNPVLRGCCAKNVFSEYGAVPEMKEGPSEPACRSRLQTAVSCFSPKGCGGERYG